MFYILPVNVLYLAGECFISSGIHILVFFKHIVKLNTILESTNACLSIHFYHIFYSPVSDLGISKIRVLLCAHHMLKFSYHYQRIASASPPYPLSILHCSACTSSNKSFLVIPIYQLLLLPNIQFIDSPS